jgi:hypothetical protein
MSAAPLEVTGLIRDAIAAQWRARARAHAARTGH